MNKVALEITTALRQLPADGVIAVLAGIQAPPAVLADVHATWLPYRNGDFRKAAKAVSATLDGHTWHWPWFELCLATFSKHKVWPDNVLGWDSFEPTAPEPKPKTPDDALNWLSLKEVRAILKAERIKPASTRRADTYNALYHQVPFAKWRDVAMSNWDAERNAAPDLVRQEYAKVELLVLTLSIATFMVDRAIQVGEFLDHPRRTRIEIDFIDKAARLMFLEASRGSPLPSLPPFYPGDRSDLRVNFGEWK